MNKKDFLHYDSKTIVTNQAGQVGLPELVNGFTVENSGNTNLFYDQDLILPGNFKAIGGNYGEIFVGVVQLKWELPVPAPAAPENQATITCKFYVKYNP